MASKCYLLFSSIYFFLLLQCFFLCLQLILYIVGEYYVYILFYIHLVFTMYSIVLMSVTMQSVVLMSVTICETVRNSHECSIRDASCILGATAYYYTIRTRICTRYYYSLAIVACKLDRTANNNSEIIRYTNHIVYF